MSDINYAKIKSYKDTIKQVRKTVLEMNYVLPDNKPRIVSIEKTACSLNVSDITSGGDIAEYTITANAELIYNALAVSEDEEHIFSTACFASKSFKESEDIDTESGEDEVHRITVDVTVDHVETLLISERKVNIKIYAAVEICTQLCAVEECAESFDDDRIVCNRKHISGRNSLGIFRVQSNISEDVELDRSLPQIENILMKSAHIQLENKKITDGKVIFYGVVHGDIVCCAEGEGDKFFATGFDVNFNQACNIPGITENASVNIKPKVQYMSLDIKDNNILGVEMTLCFEIEAFDVCEYTLICDAYLPGYITSVQCGKVGICLGDAVSENIGICSDKVSIPDGDADSVLSCSVDAGSCNTYIKEGKVYFDGIYTISVLYVPKSDHNVIRTASTTAPYGYMAESSCPECDNARGRISTKGATAQINDYGEIAVKWVATASAEVECVRYIDALHSITVGEADSGNSRCMYYHYVSENECLWDIAKRFGVTPDELCSVNGFEGNELPDGIGGVVVVKK